MIKTVFLLLALQLAISASFGQVLINEASNRNYTQVADGDNNYPDWIELYNAGLDQNMDGYFLSDSKSNLSKWAFPAVQFPQNQWMLLFASGKNGSSNNINHWETAVNDSDLWKWLNPDPSTPPFWKDILYDDSWWPSGPGGFGFGDNDDLTIFPNTYLSVYSRINFSIADTSIINAAVLHMDYDDGFIAYLNGQEIARSNVSGWVNWDTPADNLHEAVMYQGQKPEEYRLDMNLIKSAWIQGNNVLAVHAMNQSLASSDITCRTFLSFGIENTTQLFNPPPPWFNLSASATMGGHTNFKLDGKGETIYLSFGGIILDSLAIPGQMPLNASYGRSQDGASTMGVFITATPNGSNNSQTAYTNGIESEPSVDKASGFYPSAIVVSMNSNSVDAEIRYTLDGQTPTLNSALYTTPITISTSQVLNARSFSAIGKLPSATVTNTYFINETQTNAGVLSITTDNENLFGPSGIYDNWLEDWKKPSYIEYFAPGTHELAFKQRAGLRIDGGAGGSRWRPQRSFRVEPGNGTLGDGNVRYPLQPSRPNRKEYETFYLRNGSNFYLSYPIKDAIETKCMAFGTEVPYSAYTPVQVYLNGQYWGWYELREKQDADYFKQNYGIEKESLELLSVSYFYGGLLRSVEGKDAVENFNNDFNAFKNLATSSSSFWQDANLHFDLPAYIDYICMQSWLGNVDWPSNNIKIFRGPQTNNKWRYGLIDVEHALQYGITDSYFDHINYMKDRSTDIPYVNMWQRGMENSVFKANFINRFADLMNTNWHIDSLRAIANKIYNETRPEMPREYQRWGDPGNVAGHMATFDDSHNTLLNEMANRSANVRNHILTNFNLPKQVSITLDVAPSGAGKIKISTVKPSVYPWTGMYFDGVPVTIEAIANPGFEFESWDVNSLLTSVSNSVFTGMLESSETFKANFTVIGNGNQVTISEINYNSSSDMDADDWVEFWNYSTGNSVDISGWYFTDEDATHRYTFPANTVLQAGTGIIVVHDSVKFSTIYPTTPRTGNFDFKLDNAGEAIRLYDFNDNLITQLVYEDEAPWPVNADGTGKTLERVSPMIPSEKPSSWFAGCIGGSPGVAFESPCGVGIYERIITISEINYNSSTEMDADDWVEFWNYSVDNSVDISGWYFTDEEATHRYTFPANTALSAGSRIVVVRNSETFSNIYPAVPHIGNFDFGLGSAGDAVRLYDNNDNLVAQVVFDDESPWPTEADGTGKTLELVSAELPVDDASSWFAGCVGGSPGVPFDSPCDVEIPEKTITISEINYNSSVDMDADDWVEFWNYSTDNSVDISGWYFTDEEATHRYTFPANTALSAGSRIVVVHNSEKFSTIHPAVSHTGNFDFELNNAGDAVRLYDINDNLIAQVIFDNESPWPIQADGTGKTLELLSAELPVDDASSWFVGCVGGSPGIAFDSPCDMEISEKTITISEINYNSSVNMDADDWVEFWNYSLDNSVDISGWYFTDEETAHRYTFPPNTALSAGARIVVVHNSEKFSTIYPAVPHIGNFDFGLGSAGDAVRLYDVNGNLIAQVVFDNESPWPTEADGTGKTLELLSAELPVGDATSWFASCVGGSPGVAYSECIVTAIPEGSTIPGCKVYPNPTQDKCVIASSTEMRHISIIDFSGRIISTASMATQKHEIDLTDHPKGIYLLKVTFTNSTQRLLKIVRY